MYKKSTANFYIDTKNVQTVQDLYKVQTKNGLKLRMYVFLYIQISYNLHIANDLLAETAFLCFLYIHTFFKLYKMYTNVNPVIYAAADVCFFVYIKTLHRILFCLNFRISNEVLFRNFVKFQD